MRAILFLAALGLAGCGGLELKKDEKKEDYSYRFDENGCDTGKHAFKSKSAYCAGLKDEAMNHGCAAAARQTTYRNECG